MQFISCHAGQIFTTATQWGACKGNTFQTGLPALDDLLPDHSMKRGAIHEILSVPQHGAPRFFALLLARAAAGQKPPGWKNEGAPSCFLPVIWTDSRRTLYPPAVAAAGIPLDRLFLLHPQNQADESWAIAECMRCKGVGATIAQANRLSRLEARRLQLAAEKGGGVGILLRPLDRYASIYAAATRWRVEPYPGLRTVQRWKIQLVHAHGGRIGQTVILEHYRETNLVRAVDRLADRQATEIAASIRASA